MRISEKNMLPSIPIGAPEDVQELVMRTGQLFHYYLGNGCAKPKTAGKISVETKPELAYFIEVCRESQQIFGGDEYMLFDKIF